jgi:cyclophilin family peptidyl-prolyl cis-trans isomerase/HEAT repeat protein
MMQMRIQRFLLSGLVVGLLFGCGDKPPVGTDAPLPINKFDDPTILRIYDLADRRAADSLLPYLADSQATIRQEAALVFGSVQDSQACGALHKLLADSDLGVVQAAAWALGQIGDSLSGPPLLAALQEQQGPPQAAIGEALGKCGAVGEIAQAIALHDAAELPQGSSNAVMQAVYRAGLRKRVPAGAQAFAFKVLTDADLQARTYAAAFLGRVADSGPITDATQFLKLVDAQQDREVRQQLVKAFVRCQDPSCTAALQHIAGDPQEWEATRANAFRAAGSQHRLQTVAITALQDARAQVALAAAEYLDAHLDTTFGATFSIAQGVTTWRPRAILLKVALRLAVQKGSAEDRQQVASYIDGLMASAPLYERAALHVALGEDPAQHDRLLAQALKNEPVTSIYAFEAYLGYAGARDDRAVVAHIAHVLRTGDPGLIAMGAEHIANAPPAFAQQVKDTLFLDSALQSLKLPADIEAYNAVLKAKAKVLGRAPQLQELEFQHPIDWALVRRIPTGQQAEITTNRGKILLRLLVEDAPGTVGNFVELVQSGFYANKRIHRVVPAFVAQGGCPRGDGWGSSPATIRSEWAPLHYKAGMVGMASAGKDTESCQWFITHCGVPHLDGRYTIFAEVTKGLEIVQLLQIGDTIQSILLPGF